VRVFILPMCARGATCVMATPASASFDHPPPPPEDQGSWGGAQGWAQGGTGRRGFQSWPGSGLAAAVGFGVCGIGGGASSLGAVAAAGQVGGAAARGGTGSGRGPASQARPQCPPGGATSHAAPAPPAPSASSAATIAAACGGAPPERREKRSEPVAPTTSNEPGRPSDSALPSTTMFGNASSIASAISMYLLGGGGGEGVGVRGGGSGLGGGERGRSQRARSGPRLPGRLSARGRGRHR
jgi:hypothetical protein